MYLPPESTGRAPRRFDLSAPVSALSIVLVRRVFGAVMAIAFLRYFAHGWIDAQFVEPTFFFKYRGFEWVHVLPGPWMHALFAGLTAVALLLACDRAPRLSAALLGLGFTYVQLCDKANYLNHYYLVSILCGLFAVLPRARGGKVAFGWLLVLRLQIGLVYLHAGLAKWSSDWLMEGEPLRYWLADLGVGGPAGAALAWDGTAVAMAWAGMLFDLTAPFLLLFQPTRKMGFTLIVVFHAATAWLFPIGLFPWLMTLCATLLLPAAWPRRFGFRIHSERDAGVIHHLRSRPSMMSSAAAYLAVPAFLTFQVLYPFRGLAATGETHWNEDGFRFAWKVMLIDKQASIAFTINREVDGARSTEWHDPATNLTPFQLDMMSSQPDMILEYAHFLGERAIQETPGANSVSVGARSLVSLNGAAPMPLVSPELNLLTVSKDQPASQWVRPREPKQGASS